MPAYRRLRSLNKPFEKAFFDAREFWGHYTKLSSALSANSPVKDGRQLSIVSQNMEVAIYLVYLNTHALSSPNDCARGTSNDQFAPRVGGRPCAIYRQSLCRLGRELSRRFRDHRREREQQGQKKVLL